MFKFWKSFSWTTKFSIITFFIVIILGLLSMGVLGFLLYYAVSFLFKNYPSINSWHGDWFWPATISVGMFWAFGYIFAGLVTHYLKRITSNNIVICFVYLFILWLWSAFLWFLVINSNKNNLI